MGGRNPRAGRKPIPSTLKLLRGNPGKRPVNESEPKPSTSRLPHCPKHLSPGARAEWRRISRKLLKLGLLSEIDSTALGAYCDAFDRWTIASENIQKYGMIIKNAGGYLVPSPYMAIMYKSVDQMRALLAEFGMTPAARARLQVDDEAIDPFEQFLASGNKQK